MRSRDRTWRSKTMKLLRKDMWWILVINVKGREKHVVLHTNKINVK